MTWILLGGVVLVLLTYLYTLYTRNEIRRLVRTLRWIFGLGLIGTAGIVGLRGNMMLASIVGFAGAGVLMRGRLGPFDLGGGMSSPGSVSSVKSHYLSMQLDHDSGAVSGTVRAGLFSGRTLASLSAEECWALYDEVGEDPDSLALFESWLDANRPGWREYFAEQFGMDTGDEAADGAPPHTGGLSGIEEAYEVLGLSPGATPDKIRSAHRALMKKVHPDHGGSAFLAAKINAAKDLLLAETKRQA